MSLKDRVKQDFLPMLLALIALGALVGVVFAIADTFPPYTPFLGRYLLERILLPAVLAIVGIVLGVLLLRGRKMLVIKISLGVAAAAFLGAVGSTTAMALYQNGCKTNLLPERDYYHCNLTGVEFSNLDLHEADLRYAILEGAQFEGANLVGADLSAQALSGASLKGANLSDANLMDVDFEGANLAGVTADGADFTGANLYEASLRNCSLKKAVLTDAEVAGVDFSGCDLSYAALPSIDFTGSKLHGAKFVGANLEGANFISLDLQGIDFSNADLVGAGFRDCDLQGADLTDADLIDARLIAADLRDAALAGALFKGADLSMAVLTGLDLTGVKIEGANLANADLTAVDLHDVDLQDVGLNGANLDQANLAACIFSGGSYRGVNLSSTNLDSAQLDGATFKDATFTGANLCGSDLSGADLSGADLSEVDFCLATFSNTSLAGADLGGANLRDLDLRTVDFSGASLDGARLMQADMSHQDLGGIDFGQADLTGATLQGSDFTGSNLSEARLTDADLTGAVLDQVDLSGQNLVNLLIEDASLRGADLSSVDLSGTWLWELDMREANLQNANLANADLRFSNIHGADFAHSHLERADLRDTDLGGAQFSGAFLEGALLNDALLIEASGLTDEMLDSVGSLQNGTPMQTRSDVLDSLSGVCRGEGVESAEAYQRGRGLQPAVLLSESGGSHGWSDEIPTAWEPTGARFARLVVCAGSQEKKVIQSIGYCVGTSFCVNPTYLKRYRYQMEVVIRRAQDGGVVARKTFYGDAPRTAKYQESSSTVSSGLTGSKVTFEPIENWIDNYILTSQYECTDEFGCIDLAPGEPIEIGAALALGGDFPDLGADSLHGIELALEDIGDIYDHPLRLATVDSACTEEGGAIAGAAFARNPWLTGVIGANCDMASYEVAPYLGEAHIPILSPSNTGPWVTDPEYHEPTYLRTSVNDLEQATRAAGFVFRKLRLRSLATISSADDWGKIMAEQVCAEFERLGGKCVVQATVQVGDTDMRTALNAVAVESPEAIFFAASLPEGGYLITQARELSSLDEVALIGTSYLMHPELLNSARDAAEGIYLVSMRVGDDAFASTYKAFLEQYTEQYGEPRDNYHAHAYDAVKMLAKAIERVAKQDRDGTLYIPRKALLDALFSMRYFRGLTGSLNCSEFGDCADVNQLSVYQIVDTNPIHWEPGGGEEANPLLVEK
jgi:branched-chain amino acid transport system substrate-binding protein